MQYIQEYLGKLKGTDLWNTKHRTKLYIVAQQSIHMHC